MKKPVCLIALAFALACNSGSKSEKANDEKAVGNQETVAELIPHAMIDNKGQVMGQMTFPSNWKLNNEPGKAAILGPDGVEVYNIPIRNFMYSNDPMTRQIYAQNGVRLREPISATAIIQQDFVPIAQKERAKLIGVKAAPQIAQSDSKIQDMMYRIGPNNTHYEAIVSDWEDKDGSPYTIVLHVTINNMGDMVMWNYYGHGLDAPKEKHEAARKILLNGLASLQYNPRYFDKYNSNEQQRESASWAAHNQKMAQRQQQFDAQQAAFRQNSEAVNNSIMATYNSRNAASDKSHNRFLNYIKDENTVSNPKDGNRYQVQSGANQYYMNEYGQYIGTNDPNYNPNRDPATQNQNWNEVRITDQP